MEPSPLVQDTRPDNFTPKVVQLYEQLFIDDVEDFEDSEGFWQEFFLHRPESAYLKRILGDLRAEHLLQLQTQSQNLFRRAISTAKASRSPSDEIALDTLTVFLGAVLSKRYTNPSSDIISVLAGLNDADKVLMEFVGVLESIIRNGRSMEVRQKAVQTALAMTSGAWGTGLISYFTHRDLFPAIMKCALDADDSSHIVSPFLLLGLLANYNKFEFQNPYRLRLDDFVNDQAIKKVVLCVGSTCASTRDRYIAVQEDLPEGWGIGSTLHMIGLGALAPGSRATTPTPSAEEAKDLFMALPDPEAGILLSTYDFANANKLFCFNLVTSSPASPTSASPLSSFLSLTSYLFQHAHRTARASAYTYLSLFTIQILIEDPGLMKRLCGDDSKTAVRLCRQRPPYLPVIRGDRIVVSTILDIVMDGVNHNLRRRLDVQFYTLCLGVLLRIISHLSRTRTRLTYHWSELWRSLLSFIRFLTIYADDVRSLPYSSDVVSLLTTIIALSLASGEAFLPDPAAYDDLFYKLVELGEKLTEFRDAYSLDKNESMNTLIGVSAHYKTLLEEKGSKKGHLSPKEVQGVIKTGYETLSIEAREGLDAWDRYRENEWRNVLKRIGRVVVADGKAFVHE
ncbi:DUF1741-domain-containing protein [Pseudovirgaria hyperparasitica]|uniref:DUF1741-domain-containing protein n=1 Tax=Pseudovirgaria hyperparasitica TaxID=470096 RepID=A0A6A6WJ33_9PEZI|nr:DUF1741-domain-containing protein [Pseudovirgaria hyperparasitica]KAF2762195.1 DUF1741-domain-containing protein [Pseudovirgaria hyperparasitica]